MAFYRCENGGREVLTIGSDDEVLPAFSFEEEAEMFLRIGALGESCEEGGARPVA